MGCAAIKDESYWLEWQLENWARWMGSGGKPDRLPQNACVGENYTTYDTNSEQAHTECDIRLARTTNAVIDDLTPQEQCAVCNAYLECVYRFNRGNYDDVLVSAKKHIAEGLVRKGVWLGE